MKTSEIRKLKKEELEKQIAEQKEEFYKTSDEVQSGKEKDLGKSLKIRRNIARMLTVLNEKTK